MTPSRLMSAPEARASLVLGIGLAVGIRLAVYPVMGLLVTPARSLQPGGAVTIASMLRRYVLRRAFERIAGGRLP